jgi:calcium-dependent protein kinase
MFHIWATPKTDEQMKTPYLYPIPDEYAQIKFGKKLGSGHFGKVFAAIYKGEPVAVKKMKIRKQKEVELFNLEVAFMRKLNHPNILKLVDGFQLSATEYIIITEICGGGELFDAVAKRRHLTVSNAQRVAKDILSAIEYMHDMNVVHRDLKPENILLTSEWTDGPIPPVKVIDLGLAADWKGTKLYRKRGTPYYIAPDILKGRGYDKKCDLFSFGVIMYILLCGYPPFDGDNDKEIMENILTSDVSFQDEPGEDTWDSIKRETPEAIRFIQRLLRKNPKQRPSAREAFQSSFISNIELEPVEHKVATDNLRNFVQMSKLKRLIRYEISQKLTIFDKKKYLSEFGYGQTMTKEDAEKKLLTYGVDQETIEKFFDAIDVTNDQQWNVSEFVAAVMEQHVYNTYETIKRAFAEMDADKDNNVDLRELVKIVGPTDARAIFEEMFPGAAAHKQLKFTFEDLELYFNTHQPDTKAETEEKEPAPDEQKEQDDDEIDYGEDDKGTACSVQ